MSEVWELVHVGQITTSDWILSHLPYLQTKYKGEGRVKVVQFGYKEILSIDSIRKFIERF